MNPQPNPPLAGATGSADLLDEIMDVLERLERLCEQARGPGRHSVFMILNAARRNVAEAGASVSLMREWSVQPNSGMNDSPPR